MTVSPVWIGVSVNPATKGIISATRVRLVKAIGAQLSAVQFACDDAISPGAAAQVMKPAEGTTLLILDKRIAQLKL